MNLTDMKKNEPTHVVPPSGGPASAPSVLSPQSSPTPQPSKEVVEASAAEKARARKDALAEAASLLSVACRNSCDVLAQAVENDNPALINQHWRLLQERLDRAAAILKSNVEAFAP